MMRAVPGLGMEWVVDAQGCRPEPLRDRAALEALFRRVVRELGLHPLGEPLWHQFPGAGGLTGVWMLSESHLTCHSFPEHQSLCLNLFCCRPRPAWPWDQELRAQFGAARVDVRALERDHGGPV